MAKKMSAARRKAAAAARKRGVIEITPKDLALKLKRFLRDACGTAFSAQHFGGRCPTLKPIFGGRCVAIFGARCRPKRRARRTGGKKR